MVAVGSFKLKSVTGLSDDDTFFNPIDLSGLLSMPAGMPPTSGISSPNVDSGSSAGSSSIEAETVSAGYNPTTDTAQWNLSYLFGGAAQKGTSAGSATAASVLSQFHGQGVSVGIFDDGIDKSQKALLSAYDATKEVSGANPALGKTGYAYTGVHGTAVAGLIAADATQTNGTLTGLAYGSKITMIDVFDYNLYTEVAYQKNFDVNNHSYGYTTPFAMSLSSSYTKAILAADKAAADQGRGGLGSIDVFAAGNYWATSRSQTGTDLQAASRYTVEVGAVTQSGDVASYSNRGSDLLVSCYTGVATTDETGANGYASGDYVSSFGGTSAAAPQVTAIVADMLSANSKLGWRDVQKILALTAADTSSNAASKFSSAASGSYGYYGWQVNHDVYDTVNGGGLHYSNDVGFGTIDAHAAIREAEVWSYFSKTAATSANEVDLHVAASSSNVALKGGTVSTFSFKVTGNEDVENATLTFNMTTKNLDGLKIELISPSGTDIIMVDTSTATQSGSNYSWAINSHAFLGEAALGTWTVKVTDTTSGDVGSITGATLDLYGSAVTNQKVFHYTDDVFKMESYDASRLTIHHAGGVGDWLDTAAMSIGNLVIDLFSGHSSSAGGKIFECIGTDTVINNCTVGDGVAKVIGNNNGDTVVAGHGTDTVICGTGADTVYAGYGVLNVLGGAGNDTFAINHTGFGTETIGDFTQGADKIDLRGLGLTWDAIKSAMTDNGSTIKMVLDSVGDVLTLTNTHGQHLAQTDFLFA